MRRMMASPSKMRLGSFSSRVSSTRAALRSLLRANCTRQSSRLLRRPNSPTVFSSLSRRSFSNGRRGFLKVLESVMGEGIGSRGQYGACGKKARCRDARTSDASTMSAPARRANYDATESDALETMSTAHRIRAHGAPPSREVDADGVPVERLQLLGAIAAGGKNPKGLPRRKTRDPTPVASPTTTQTRRRKGGRILTAPVEGGGRHLGRCAV